MTIAWDKLLQVFGATVGGALAIVVLFALGVRFLTDAQALAPKTNKGKPKAGGKEAMFRTLAYICFIVAALAVAYEVFILVQPLLFPAPKE